MSEQVIKFNGLSRTVDIEVHVIHVSHVIITYIGIIIFPHTDKTQGPTHMVEGDTTLEKFPNPYPLIGCCGCSAKFVISKDILTHCGLVMP